jgi:hypothetical protein
VRETCEEERDEPFDPGRDGMELVYHIELEKLFLLSLAIPISQNASHISARSLHIAKIYYHVHIHINDTSATGYSVWRSKVSMKDYD